MTTDQELKKLNKTVEDAVNALRIMVGNPSQMKNYTEKQREAIDKWFDVTVEEEEQQKKQRAFTERVRDEHGRFIKKQDDSTTKQAKTFMGMAKSVGGMFKGMAKTVGSSIGSIARGVSSHLKNFFGQLQSQFVSLFGEESEWFGILGSIKDSMMGVMGWITKGLFKNKWVKKQYTVLRDMYRLQVKQMKMDWADTTDGAKKKGGVWGILGGILIGIAAGIGAWLHRYLILLTKLPIFGKIAKMFQVIDDIPYIGKLFKAVKFGFKWLGWPLTILLSVIDFIKGYAETDGSTWEKIKGGLWKAVEGFIKLPVVFIGWVTETILGWFGIEVKDVGDKIMGFIKAMFMSVIYGWEQLLELIKIETITLVKNIPRWIGKLMGAVEPIITGIHNFFVDFWNAAVEWITGRIPDWLGGNKIRESLTSTSVSKMETTPTTQSVTDVSASHEKAKIEQQKKTGEEFDKKMDELIKSTKASSRATENSINSMSQMNAGGGGGGIDVQQLPDEIDNGVLGWLNLNGGTE